MKKFEFKNIGVTGYKYVCKNGLKVYLVPNKTVRSFLVTLNIKYGSDILKFKVDDKLIEVPAGSAHFLEHKMFEQENGITPFDFYSELGIECNASTNNKKTDYMFSGSGNLKKGLNFLLDYVESPYFTDENVEKEKGIIKQEILMYEDEPSQKLYNRSLYNAYFKNPIRHSVGGKVSDIMKITKEDLYNIYDAFYQPQNKFLVITGNINAKEVIGMIEKNQNRKKYVAKDVKIINEKEKDEIKTKFEEIYDNVFISKFALNIKINIRELKKKIPHYPRYLSFYLETVLGSTSKLKEKLTHLNLITYNISSEIVTANDYCSIVIMGETDKYEEVIEYIIKALKSHKYDAKEFNLNKKMLKSYYVFASDNIYSINSFIVNQIIVHDEINENIYLDVDKMNKTEYNYVISQVDFNNYGVVVIKPKNEK